MIRSKKEEKILIDELKIAEKQDKRIISKGASKDETSGLSGKIREKIPEKALSTLEKAFEKGFTLILEKGGFLIESTKSLEHSRKQFEKYKASLDKMIYLETLKAIDKSAQSRILISKGTTTAEGSALGIFGIGLPDIPIFLGMLLKVSYEIAASYGIDYREEEELKYTLSLLKTAFSSGAEKQYFSRECDSIGKSIDDGDFVESNISDEDVKKVSEVLATDMLVSKFIQGMTFFGVVGGPLNYRLIHKLSKVAKVKYKKRFLYRMINDK